MHTNHTHSYLKQQISYDPDTGMFQWLFAGKGRPKYPFAGTPIKRLGRQSEIGAVTICDVTPDGDVLPIKPEYKILDGYRVTIDKQPYMAHELAAFLMTGVWRRVYHADGDKLNNKWTNLTPHKPKVNKVLRTCANTKITKSTALGMYAKEHGTLFTPIQELEEKRKAVLNQVEYNPSSGNFRRKLTPKLGWSKGIKVNNGSYAISITILTPYGQRKTTVPAHVAAYICYTGDYPQGKVHHINKDNSDNRWENLNAK